MKPNNINGLATELAWKAKSITEDILNRCKRPPDKADFEQTFRTIIVQRFGLAKL